MFSLFGTRKEPSVITSTIVFDEGYCHSAGDTGGQTYEIKPGTTDILFVFGKFDEFIGTYLFNNPYLPEEVKHLVRNKQGFFGAQVVQGGAYLCTDSVNPDGHIVFRSQSLKPLNRNKKLDEFVSGAIAFGILQPGTSAFHVLWATMYQATKRPPTF
jgi:hypothetical protein